MAQWNEKRGVWVFPAERPEELGTKGSQHAILRRRRLVKQYRKAGFSKSEIARRVRVDEKLIRLDLKAIEADPLAYAADGLTYQACSEEGCDYITRAKGLCRRHYDAARNLERKRREYFATH